MLLWPLTMLCCLHGIVQDFVTGPPDAGTVVTRGTFGVENVTGPGHVSGCAFGMLLPCGSTCTRVSAPSPVRWWCRCMLWLFVWLFAAQIPMPVLNQRFVVPTVCVRVLIVCSLWQRAPGRAAARTTTESSTAWTPGLAFP
jgi:hypothetical protein